MSEGLVRKRRIRAGHRGVVTKRIAEAQALLGEADPDPIQLARFVSIFEEKLTVLRRLDEEVLELLEDEGVIVKEIEESDEKSQGLYEILLRLRQVIEMVSTKKSKQHTSPDRTGLEEKGVVSKQARLPKLTLHPFDGSVTNWISFWEMYDASIHSNSDLSEVQKFSYLRSLVEGSAREAIEGLSLSKENYREAIDILKQRFGNKQKIIDKHLNLLLNIERVSSANNIVALRRLSDSIETNTRALRALGVNEDSYGALLSSVLVQRLPQELRLIAGREIKGDWTLPEILKVLKRELEARERTVTPLEGVHQLGGGAGSMKKSDKATATALLSGQSNPRERQSPFCCYCQKNHLPEECRKIVQVEDRRKLLRLSGRCFLCLRRGHVVRDCHSKNRCQVCKGKHHRSLCRTDSTSESHADSTQNNTKNSGSTTGVSTTQTTTHLLTSVKGATKLNPNAPVFRYLAAPVRKEKMILLQTATARIFNPRNPGLEMEGTVIFDSGSQRSYISQAAIDQLQLRRCGSQVLSIITFGDETGYQQRCDVVKVGLKRGDLIDELTLLSVPSICGEVKRIPQKDLEKRYPQLAKLDLADQVEQEGVVPVILIGLNYYWEFVTGEVIQCTNGPVATRTSLGWIISGPVMTKRRESTSTTNLVTHVLRVSSTSQQEEVKRLERKLKAFWDLESLGILDKDGDIYDQFQGVVSFQDGRYTVSLPWKEPSINLPSNYELSLKRLRTLVRRLRQDNDLFRQYNQVISDQITNGIVTMVPDPEMDVEENRVHYLPHHAVIKHDKDTTKVRVVYDASARTGNGPSLNDTLLIGPKFNQRIMDILLRFRCFPIALIADIEKAFLMIGIERRDQDVLRFLWLEDWTKEPTAVQVYRFTRVVFGVASSPFLLNATIRYHLEGYRASHSCLVDRLEESTYVDDVVFGAGTPEEAVDLYKRSKAIFKEGGFNLRKFVTNEVRVQSVIDDMERNQEVTDGVEVETYAKAMLGGYQKPSLGEVRVLGVLWRVTMDDLVFDLSEVIETALRCSYPTKRKVASIIGRVYDPLGMLSPLIIPLKVFLQDLSVTKMEWDDVLSEPLLGKWRKLVKGLCSDSDNHQVTFLRCILRESQSRPSIYSIYGFGDASQRAYAAVVYLRVEEANRPHYHLICAKSRVSPVETLSIPRLELLSALILSRLVSRVSEALNSVLTLEPPTCFLDSKVAYYWISGQERSWKPFIQNRVSEIRRRVPPSRWRHCTGNINPADAPSRGQNMVDFLANSSWFTGPEECLDTNQEEVKIEMPLECEDEMMRSKSAMPDQPLMTAAKNAPETVLLKVSKEVGIETIIDVNDYSDVERLFGTTAKVLEATARFKGHCSEVAVEWLKKAEVLWVKAAQSLLVTDPRYQTWRDQFNLFLDQNELIRCRGRLKNADITYSTRYPLLLPRDHRLTLLFIRRAHERVFHNGVRETLTELRTRYWILKGRRLVQSVVSKCVLCRRLEGPRYHGPPPPPLPSFRLEEGPPFTYCGVDFAGPLFVRVNQGSSCVSKVWICLYTCCTTRGIHLELVQDMTTASFIRCFRRFTARRGVPRLMVSDNGKTFKGAAKLLAGRRKSRHHLQSSPLETRQMEWRFNIERAPWWGGFFERLVRSTKRCLKKVIGTAKLLYEELATLIIEVEAIINSRPLSFVSPLDLEEPLTPSHLILGRRILSSPDDYMPRPGDEEKYIANPESLTKRMSFLQRTLDHFWRRWRKEYLLELRSAHAASNVGKRGGTHVAEGDIVVVHSENEKRCFWRLGVIEKLIKGQDGMVRGAQVRVSVNGHRTAIWRRPVERLHPLEVNCSSEDLNEAQDVEDTSSDFHGSMVSQDSSGDFRRRMPKRQAAIQAQEKINRMI